MQGTSKISVANIVYNFISTEHGDKSGLFDKYIRIAYRAAAQMYSFESIEHSEHMSIIKDSRIKLPRYFTLDEVLVDGQLAYYTGSEANVRTRRCGISHDHIYKFNIEQGCIKFNWHSAADLQGLRCDFTIGHFEEDEDGFILVPFNFEEAIIAFLRAEDAYDLIKKSKGRVGSTLYQIQLDRYDKLALAAETQNELPDRAEWDACMRIFNTKIPIYRERRR